MQIICGICENSFDEKEMTTITPSKYLGGQYPAITSFCPECFRKFLIKAQEIYNNEENIKKNNLKNLINL